MMTCMIAMVAAIVVGALGRKEEVKIGRLEKEIRKEVRERKKNKHKRIGKLGQVSPLVGAVYVAGWYWR